MIVAKVAKAPSSASQKCPNGTVPINLSAFIIYSNSKNCVFQPHTYKTKEHRKNQETHKNQETQKN